MPSTVQPSTTHAPEAAAAAASDNEDDKILDPYSSANSTGLQLGAFQHIFNNQAELPTCYKMVYIIMMKVDLENRRLMNEFEKDVTNTMSPTLFTPEK